MKVFWEWLSHIGKLEVQVFFPNFWVLELCSGNIEPMEQSCRVRFGNVQ
jgi:hypothetical protein